MKNITAEPNISIRQAMKNLNKSGEKCLVIIDQKNTLLGTLSDGDLRKAILKGSAMGDPIQSIYQSTPTVLIDGKYALDEANKLFTRNKFYVIPVIDIEVILTAILFCVTVLINGNN